MMPFNTKTPAGRIRGFSMIEILVTIVVLSIGLLGLAGLQLTGLKYNHSAYLRSQATLLASDIIDRMRANRQVALTGGYDLLMGSMPGNASCVGPGQNCTPAEMATADIAEWKQALQDLLPAGDGSIERQVNGNEVIFTVTIQWDDTRGESPPIQLPVRTVL